MIIFIIYIFTKVICCRPIMFTCYGVSVNKVLRVQLVRIS